jgi:signal transduction histidine kinase
LPAFGLIVYSASKHHKLTAEQIKLNALMAARAIASEQDRALDSVHQFLVTVSRVPQVRGDDQAACHKSLSSLLEPRYADLIVADRDGKSLCTALKSESTIATASGMHHKTAVETFDFAVGSIRFDRGSKKPLLDVSYPIMEPAGAIRAVISAAVDLSWLSHMTVDNHLYPGTTFSLVNRDGIVLQRYPEGLDWVGKSIIEASDAKIVAANGAETNVLTGVDGVRRLFAFSPLQNALGGQATYAVIDVPVKTALVKTREILIDNLIALGVFSAIVLGLAWFGADLFVLRRINDIIAATHNIASGDLKARTTLPYDKSELGQMAKAFDHLAQALETRKNQADESTRQIHKQRQQQEALYQLNRAMTSTLDTTSVLRTLLDHICALFPSCAVSVSWANKDAGRLEPIACRGFKDDDQALAELTAATSLPRAVFTSQVPVTIADASSDERNGDRDLFLRHQLRAYIGLPLIVRQDMLGVLSLYISESMECGPDEVSFLGALVDEAAIAIHNSRLFERTLEQALELEKSNKIKDEFLGVMSHELRTPLNIIMNYAEALKMETFGEIAAGQIRAIDKIRAQARELLLLINGILEITKIESHTVSVQNEALHLMEFISEIRSDYDFPMEKNLALEWQYAELPLIISDGAKLRHILTNLINNAIKFTEKGTVAVSAHTTADKSALDLRVADTGPGIPSEQLPFVFDKFRQVDSATTRNHCGVGLGLFIVKNFVELLGGSIEVTSQLGEGSVFTVRLPIRAVPDAEGSRFKAAPGLGPAA